MLIKVEIPLALAVLLGWWLTFVAYVTNSSHPLIWITGPILTLGGCIGFYLIDKE